MDTQNNRQTGQTKDTGWQIGVRRTLPIRHEKAWALITSPEGLKIWLGAGSDVSLSEGGTYQLPDGAQGEVRVWKKNSHLRITWQPKGWPRSSTIQVRTIPKEERTTIAFHQEHLPGPDERQARRKFFMGVLDQLEKMI
jgi:uncharacterized protein YndB with AHSA1/START domain